MRALVGWFALVVLSGCARPAESVPSPTSSPVEAAPTQEAPSRADPALAALPPEPAAHEGNRYCIAQSACGCENGCVEAMRILQPGGGERFRVDGRLFMRRGLDYPIEPMGEPACEESCRPAPARARCGFVEGVCRALP